MKYYYYLSLAVMALAMQSTAQADDKQAMLEDALSAAPPTLKDKVTVMDWDNNVLQKGTSNYTCFPTPPQLKGKAPMCMDGPWMDWAKAWMNKQPVEIKTIGISYMLGGDGGASNTDPYAESETADNQWIVEGPHLMIITPDKALLDSLPTDPNNGGPYVMWKDTPYQHIMVPIGPRP
ncbi:hypothetical protein L4174_020015 [Photobacterium sp. CCB-ST2H9]|uniref:hypothetical protein n=1 Tax=Photobacterium sp. CCB-ST2H9 TaxID=2912855 RepID=UPI002006B68B|nr:hypothetical protein [Photobacterium sp. CCB-ST2H9]UTM59007.1 hypothetical protein L4174_020015 [Photobacterium sp. CCB-ST2H9]